MNSYITNIYHLSSHDGPGARTTLFFKGCSLHCAWCHNPETISPRQQILWKRELCISCGRCMESCERGALHLSDAVDYLDSSLCVSCFSCVDSCPSTALHFAAREYSVEQLAAVVRKDRPLFMAMRGGVTFSGGEPALRAPFIEALIEELGDSSICYALDSCGQAPFDNYERLLPHMSHLLYDLKEMNSARHNDFTGSGNELILENLHRIVELIQRDKLPTKIWIRTPLIPDYTATRANIEAIAHFIASLPAGIVERWECCCFNNLCSDKYSQLGEEWCLKDEPLMARASAEQILAIAKAILPDMDLRVMGLTRREDDE